MNRKSSASPLRSINLFFVLCVVAAGYLFSPATARADEKLAAPAARAFKVEVTGRGRPMILIPGLASSGEVWEATVAHYKNDYECHVLTLAGFAGQPALAPDAAGFVERVRGELARYIRERRLTKPVVVGHSLGGVLALALASREPDLTGPLVIVDSLPFLPASFMPGATSATMKPQAEAMRAGVISGAKTQTPEQARRAQEAILRTMISDEANIARALRWGAASDAATIGAAMYELFTIDLRESIARIKSPTLVIGTWIGLQPYATRDSVTKVYQEQYAKLPGTRIVISDKAKHFVMYDDAPGFFDETDRFLAEHSRHQAPNVKRAN